MGTRIDVFFAKDFPLFGDEAATLQRLRRTEPACRRVTEYWRGTGSKGTHLTEWVLSEVLADSSHFDGPGSLRVEVRAGAARVRTGGRWRGFLRLPALRAVHLAAFRSIGLAFGSDVMAITHDNSESLHETFCEGGTLQDCIATLRATLGAPQPSIDAVDPSVVTAAEHEVPNVWYLDRIAP